MCDGYYYIVTECCNDMNFEEFKTFYEKFPDRENTFYYTQFPKAKKTTIRSYKYRCKKEYETPVATKKNKPKSTTKPSTPTSPPLVDFIDDPDELLMSVAIRELNKANPDPRWASILINCKKENIIHKDEVLNTLQKQPTRNIVEILQKQHTKSWQTE